MRRLAITLLLWLSLAAGAEADALDYLKRGLAARQHGDNDAAIYYLSAAIAAGAFSPNDLATVLASRGVAYDDKGETDSAIADFNAALVLRPDFGDAYTYRGLAWVKKHEYDRAILDFTEGSNIDPEHAFLALNNRGNVYQEEGDYDHAIEDFSKVIRLKPDYAPAYYNRANTYNAIRIIRQWREQMRPDGPRSSSGRGAQALPQSNRARLANEPRAVCLVHAKIKRTILLCRLSQVPCGITLRHNSQ